MIKNFKRYQLDCTDRETIITRIGVVSDKIRSEIDVKWIRRSCILSCGRPIVATCPCKTKIHIYTCTSCWKENILGRVGLGYELISIHTIYSIPSRISTIDKLLYLSLSEHLTGRTHISSSSIISSISWCEVTS